ncbi:MAG: IS4 family transposase [Acidobacteriaceae bacterium]|nr:IS4 family transposase [Acidobacteriaceae bacterium]
MRLLLPTREIESWCHAEGYVWRRRIWEPVVTLLACVFKQLTRGSTREVEDWIASLYGDGSAQRYGSNFCAARQRLPLSIFKRAVKHVGGIVTNTSGLTMKDLRVWLLDGTTLRTVNTRCNDAQFGRSRNSVRESRSPILRMILLACAGSGAVLDVAIGPYVTSELALFGEMLRSFPANGLLVADSCYATFMSLTMVQRRGSHLLARYRKNHQRCLVKRLARGDELHRWKRPSHSTVVLWAKEVAGCPEFMEVRIISGNVVRKGYRTWELCLATTLLDPKQYPADELIALYLRRWDVELSLRTLKTDYQMAQLTAKSPELVHKEILSMVLAYNCVVATIAASGQSVRRVSHVRARTLLLLYSERMVAASTVRLPSLHKEMLKFIATAMLTLQVRLPQPRAIVQRPSPYPVLMTTRDKWRREYYAA